MIGDSINSFLMMKMLTFKNFLHFEHLLLCVYVIFQVSVWHVYLHNPYLNRRLAQNERVFFIDDNESLPLVSLKISIHNT